MKRRVFVAFLLGVLAVPSVVVAADRFSDVSDENVFHDDIAWLDQSGVTKGCNPPDNTQYCPDDSVTRGQMAAFLRRLAENEVVDAADSELLDGLDSSQFLKADGSVAVQGAIPYASPVLHTISIPKYAFVSEYPEDANEQVLYTGATGARILPGGTGRLVAPLVLPSGAEIVEITLHAYDANAVDDLSARVTGIRLSQNGGIGGDIATTSGDAGRQSVSQNTFVVIDASDYAYSVDVQPADGLEWPGNQIGVIGVTITYRTHETG
ncbi:MAG: S-layer homology domain-containing protein [Acidimicrobiia bacterium]|nr:S-layer homology domain-containing protein [Acidimicrobiia bacterium]MDH4307484.1 S-layer homology domain-containing protein [Acidimicrobiia bacterium]